MVREIDLAEHTGVARAELRNLRREAVGEKHWMLFGKAIVWTDTGLKWLSERLSVGLGDLLPQEAAERTATVQRARIYNHRLIRVIVDGEREPALVKVGDNKLYRHGMRVLVRWEGNGYVATRRPKVAKS